MKLFHKVAIVGTGLIGGSIALNIKKKKLCDEVIGVSRHKETLALAKRGRAIDKGSQDLKIIKDADLVILATPVSVIFKFASRIRKAIRPDCIVTDVGSTKAELVQRLERIFPRYVGAHPLAGSEKRGIVYARQDIFKGSICIITPTKRTDRSALNKVKRLWRNLGAEVIFLSPQKHDRVLSFVSHLPHAAAFSLINAIPRESLKFGASGLRDTTRIAASESRIWSDIFLTNRKNMLRAIDLLQQNLNAIKSSIQKKDSRRLIRILGAAKAKRENWE